MRRFLLASIVVLLLFTLAACSSPESPSPPATVEPTAVAAAPTAEPTKIPAATRAPTRTPRPTATPTAVPPRAANVSTLPDVQSYRVAIGLNMDGKDKTGQAVTSNLTMLFEETRKPRAFRWSMSIATGDVEPLGAMDFYHVGDDIYMRLGDIWQRLPAGTQVDQSEPMSFLEADSLAEELSSAQKVGVATVNGRSTTHYRFDKALIEAISEERGDEIPFGDLETAAMDLWVDNQHQFVVKYVMKATGTFVADGQEVTGEYSLTYDVSDINGAFVITVPAEARR